LRTFGFDTERAGGVATGPGARKRKAPPTTRLPLKRGSRPGAPYLSGDRDDYVTVRGPAVAVGYGHGTATYD